MKKITLILILFFVTITTFSQEITLSKKQMYQDFDQLVKIIEDGNPQLEVRKIVTGYHQLDTIKSLRKNIDTITNYESFRSLLNMVLFYCFDAHTREEYTFFVGFDNLKDIDTVAIMKRKEYVSSPEYIQKFWSKKHQDNFSLSFNYYNGNYWILGDHFITKKGGIDTIHISLMKIMSYNGKDFTRYVEQNANTDFYYDFLTQKYYNKWFKIPRKGILEGKQEGKIIKFNVEDYVGANMNSLIMDKFYNLLLKDASVPQKENIYTPTNTYPKRVDFFDKDSILYIYLDQMIIDTAFCNKIKNVGKDKKINKVLIDVRGNGGGSDYAWYNLLKAIIKDTLTYSVKLAYNDSKIIHDKFKGFHPNMGTEKIEWLNYKKMCLLIGNIPIKPDVNSLKYDGKIYVISDKRTYSAAHSLVNFAAQFDNIISIGCPTGQIVGFGINPQLFQLKNSKFTFRMPCTIDILNCNKAIDAYQDFPEILVYPTFEEEMIYPRTVYDCKSEAFLRTFDSMFHKVLEME